MKQWYAGHMSCDFLKFKSGEQVFYRKAEFQHPLQVGPVFIVFRTTIPASFRFTQSMGLLSILSPWPNNVNPKPAPEDKNLEIEIAYLQYLKKNPVLRRHSQEEKQRILSQRRFQPVQLPTTT